MRGARHRLLRELAPRHALAARVRDRQPRAVADYARTRSGGSPPRDGPLDTTIVHRRPARGSSTRTAARGAGTDEINDDGTIAPTAAGGSIPFAPEITIPALIAMRGSYGDALFSTYGFLDAFNPTLRLTRPSRCSTAASMPASAGSTRDYLGIDQGPILAMIENYRSDLVWRLMRKNPYIIAGSAGRASPAAGSQTHRRGFRQKLKSNGEPRMNADQRRHIGAPWTTPAR